MIKLTGLILLALMLNNRCASHEPRVDPADPTVATGQIVSASPTPAILEADAEGIGKAIITDHIILVKLPAGYTKPTVRLTYKVTAGVQKITPASGQDIPVRAAQTPTVCIQTDASGNCTLSYQLIIQTISALRVTLDPASLQLDVNRYLQPYALNFQLANLNAQTGVTRRFQVRFTNKTTGYTYLGENYMVNDKTGNVVFINQPNVTVPDEGQLRMTGTLPLDMTTGEYAVSVLIPTCYALTTDGQCQLTGTEGVDLAEPFVLRPGLPLVGETSSMPSSAGELVIKGRNFSAANPLTVRFTNDFTQPVDAPGLVETETVARLAIPTGVVSGQYRLDVVPPGGSAYSALFVVPGTQLQPAIAYVGLLGNYVATQNGLPTLPALKGNETLEVRYAANYTQPVKGMRLVDTKDPNHTVDLTGNVAFRPYAAATDFVMWKWTLPAGLPKGRYALVFEGTDGVRSLPYYQQIRVD